MQAGFALGADDYMTKPFSTEELCVRVGARLATRLIPVSAAARYSRGAVRLRA